MRLVLDSAFLIDIMGGVDEALVRHRSLFEAGDEPYITDIVVCEVRAGLRAQDVEQLETLIGPIEFIQPDRESAMLAGAWRRAARERGRHLSLPDALIASAAAATDAAVLTRNVKDFALTPVRVETY